MSDAISTLTVCKDDLRQVGGQVKIENRGATNTYLTGVGGSIVTGTARHENLNIKDLGTLRKPVIVYKALTAATGNAGALSWQNTTGDAINIDRVVVVVTAAAGAAATLDVGVASTATTAENLIDDLDVNAATGTFDNLINGGTAGKAGARCANDYYVTGTLSYATDFEGYILIYYTKES